MTSTSSDGKKRKRFLQHIVNKRPRPNRVSSSGVKEAAPSATEDEDIVLQATSQTLSFEKKPDLESPRTSTSDPCTHVCAENKENATIKPRGWNCGSCTLLNPENRKRCTACGSRRPIADPCAISDPHNAEYSTPGKVHPMQIPADTSVDNMRSEELKTPTIEKADDVSTLNENNTSRRTARQVICDPPSKMTAGSNERSAQRKRSKRPALQSVCLRLSSPAIEENTSSSQVECANDNENARLVQHDHETLRNEQQQLTLAKVLNELKSMNELIRIQKDEIGDLTKLIRDQSEEIRILREQNVDMLLTQDQMKSSLFILETRSNARQPNVDPKEAPVQQDEPSSVTPEERYADVVSKDCEATPRRQEHSPVQKCTPPTGIRTLAVEPVLKLVDPVNLLEDDSAEQLERRTEHAAKDSQKLPSSPPSPAASTQTIDPDASSQMAASKESSVSKRSLPDRLLKNRTNQALPNQVSKAWVNNKHARQFISEMEKDIPRKASASWMTTRPKLTSTAPFCSATNPGQDTLFEESPQPKYAYKETVRCRKDRQALPCHDCDECRYWYLTLKNTGHEFSQDPLSFSRHRSRFQPHESPVDFWEMSFVDERKARQAEEAERKAREAEETEK
ncbi:hypothetical protein FisN_1Hh293 [Fistulifera solaris]|uniref:RanBP2-type domain-containing protein n=1 Tax=Fistulifera solaris TaxID=1519565 RepID=A0A1Z5JED3_FISSO|nr:hypothetical protein FisN_1Hh293 [Fistulifera solaris]|eukprot:GAX12360.1 hypothetical protein FisN_1Hh293 [Fistulifera solaris]